MAEKRIPDAHGEHMRGNRWDRIVDLFGAASQLNYAAREDFLQEACDDEEIRAEVCELLACHDSTEDKRFNDTPGLRMVAKLDQTPAESAMIGRNCGPFRIQQLIGRGGFSDVYRAQRLTDFKQTVAVKVLRTEHASGSTTKQRFEIERQVLADLSHDNIARILDGGHDEWGRPYLAMEFVGGGDLVSYCNRMRLTVRERVELFRKVCDAVGHAHTLGIVHRDIKPGNILVGEHGDPKLVDFGIAKLTYVAANEEAMQLTRTGLLPMTPYYASPEQVRGEPVGLASDVYSLGVVLYELVSGKHPYNLKTTTPQELSHAVCTSVPKPPSKIIAKGAATLRSPVRDDRLAPIPKLSKDTDLDNVVLMALRKEPNRRYRSGADLADDLGRYLEGKPVLAGAESWSYRLRSTLKQHRIPLAAAGLVLTSLVGGLIASSLAWQREKETSLQLQTQVYSQYMTEGFQAIASRDFQLARDIFQRHQDTAVVGGKGIEWSVLEQLSALPTPKVFGGHDAAVNELASVPGTPHMISVGDDNQIRMWDTNTGELVKCLRGRGPFASVAVSNDGRYVAAGQDTSKISDEPVARVGLWDLDALEFIKFVAENLPSPESLAFSPDGKRLVVGPRYEPMVEVSIPTGSVIQELHPGRGEPLPPRFPRYRSLRFLQDGSLLSAGRFEYDKETSGYLLQLWNVNRSGAERYFEKDLSLRSFDITSDDSLVVATDDKLPILALFDIATGALLGEAKVPFGKKCVAISSDGRRVAIGFSDGNLQHWQIHPKTETQNSDQSPQNGLRFTAPVTFRAHENQVSFLAFAENGRLVSGGADGLVKSWPLELVARPQQFLSPPCREFTKVELNHDGNIQVQSSDSGVFFHIPNRNQSNWMAIPPNSFKYSSICRSSDGDHLAIGKKNGRLQIVGSLSPHRKIHDLAAGRKSVVDVEFSPDDKLVAATGSSTSIFSVSTGERVQRFTHDEPGTVVRFSPSGRMLACGGSSDVIQIHDVRSGRLFYELRNDSPVESIDWQIGEDMLATSHTNGKVVLHMLDDSPTTTSLGRHAGLVPRVIFTSPNRLVSCSYASLQFWHVSTRSRLGELAFDKLLGGSPDDTHIIGLAKSSDASSLLVFVNHKTQPLIFALPLPSL